MIKKAVFAALASAVLFAAPAHAAGDAAAGEKVFAQCKACHENEKGVSKVGPTLKGVVGRKAASVEGYKYSAAMTKKGEPGRALGASFGASLAGSIAGALFLGQKPCQGHGTESVGAAGQ